MPTSFSGCSYLVLRLIMMFSANRGTPRFFSPFDQIKAVAHIEKSPVSPPFRHYMLEHPWFSFHSGLMTLNYGILGLWTQSGLPVKPCKNVVSLASDTQFITFKGVTQPAAPSGSMDHVLQYRPKTARFQPFYPVYYIQICPRDVRNLTVFAELGVWRWRKNTPSSKACSALGCPTRSSWHRWCPSSTWSVKMVRSATGPLGGLNPLWNTELKWDHHRR